MRGLLGTEGIAPAAQLLERVRAGLGADGWKRVPTLLWWNASDAALLSVCGLGAAVSLALAAGIAPRINAVLAWLLYLSLVSVGDAFLMFQWDGLLLETLLVSAAFAPRGLRPRWRDVRVPAWSRYLLAWLLFRVVWLSGAVKLTSGDEVWSGLTALEYHYWTQPLPHALSHFAHHLPAWLHRASCAAMFAIELGAPLLLFGPPRVRRIGAASIAGLLALIVATGNYGFFEPLVLVLCIAQWDDDAPGWRRRSTFAPSAEPNRRWRTAAAVGFTTLAALLTANASGRRLGWTRERWRPLSRIEYALAPTRSFNSYGLFATMTTERPEVIVEGSRDGQRWRAYEFAWKPGDIARRPGFAGPHMPRLDWQMWFAALSGWNRSPWIQGLARGLLEASDPVTDLLAHDPFGDTPPRFVRFRRFAYRFSTPEERARGTWWQREPTGAFGPTLELVDGRLRAVR